AVEAALGVDLRDAAVIVGTSAGAGLGSLLRAGVGVADVRARIERRPMSSEAEALAAGLPPDIELPPLAVRRAGRLPHRASRSMVRAELRRPWAFRVGHLVAAPLPLGSVSPDPIRLLHDHLHRGRRWPEQPLWINTLRLADGAHVVLGRDATPEPS